MQKGNRLFNFFLLLVCTLPLQLSSQIRSTQGEYDSGMRPEFTERITFEDRAKMKTSRIKKACNLPSDTLKMIYKVYLKYEQEADEFIKPTQEMNAYDRAMLKKIRDAEEADVMALLNSEQRSAYTTMQQSMKLRFFGENQTEEGNKSRDNR